MLIQVGSVVRLKSGGPKMSVMFISEGGVIGGTAEDEIHCKWFNGNDVKEDHFHPESLEVVDPSGDGDA